jgi:hypothetical protein
MQQQLKIIMGVSIITCSSWFNPSVVLASTSATGDNCGFICWLQSVDWNKIQSRIVNVQNIYNQVKTGIDSFGTIMADGKINLSDLKTATSLVNNVKSLYGNVTDLINADHSYTFSDGGGTGDGFVLNNQTGEQLSVTEYTSKLFNPLINMFKNGTEDNLPPEANQVMTTALENAQNTTTTLLEQQQMFSQQNQLTSDMVKNTMDTVNQITGDISPQVDFASSKEALIGIYGSMEITNAQQTAQTAIALNQLQLAQLQASNQTMLGNQLNQLRMDNAMALQQAGQLYQLTTEVLSSLNINNAQQQQLVDKLYRQEARARLTAKGNLTRNARTFMSQSMGGINITGQSETVIDPETGVVSKGETPYYNVLAFDAKGAGQQNNPLGSISRVNIGNMSTQEANEISAQINAYNQANPQQKIPNPFEKGVEMYGSMENLIKNLNTNLTQESLTNPNVMKLYSKVTEKCPNEATQVSMSIMLECSAAIIKNGQQTGIISAKNTDLIKKISKVQEDTMGFLMALGQIPSNCPDANGVITSINTTNIDTLVNQGGIMGIGGACKYAQ